MRRSDHDCVYGIADVPCGNRRCKPVELCIRGRRVYRSVYGGHHHSDDLEDRSGKEET